MNLFLQQNKNKFIEFGIYLNSLLKYIRLKLLNIFYKFEKLKSFLVGGLTVKRGKYIRPFLHSSMTGLFLIGLALAPIVNTALAESEDYVGDGIGGPLIPQDYEQQSSIVGTQISFKPRDNVVSYIVQPGDTISSISKKFDVSEDSIRWLNDLSDTDIIKKNEKLEIPPVTGVVHKVKRGDTIYSIAKKYNVDAQGIVNWPFNNYTNDENFGLAVGQFLMVPDGVMPKKKIKTLPKANIIATTPDAGQVSATGSFAWPTNGIITQRFSWYHGAIDIANPSGPPVLAADSGVVIVAGWPDNWGYGNRVMVDHGNGYVTLYAHLSAINVTQGQRVNMGDQLGVMGNTGRSTGTHLHFEIRLNGKTVNPLSYLK